MLLGGPRALLLQLAHPLVAAGVAEHSSFQSDPLLRLRRTLDATLAMVFGTKAEAEEAAGKVNRVHGFVSGTLPEDAGRYKAGTPYTAGAPDLLLWVHATLIDTTFTVYPRYVGELSEADAERAYQESKITGIMLGVPEELLPKDLGAFRAYMEAMIASDEITGATFQRKLARDVLYPKVGPVPGIAFLPAAGLTTSLLPPRVRENFGLKLTATQKAVAAAAKVVVRGMLPVMPKALREQPQAREADRRVGA